MYNVEELKQRYKTFIPKTDGSQEIISAEDINNLQYTVEEVQEKNLSQDDRMFVTKALFSLNNHETSNAIMMDTLSTSDNLNLPLSSNVYYDAVRRSIVYEPQTLAEGIMDTKILANPNQTPYRKLILLVSEFKESGTDIFYEFSYDGVTFHPITPNQGIPVDLIEERTSNLTLRFRFQTTELEKIARIDAWALLYQDEAYMIRFMEDGLNIDIESPWDGTIIP